MTVTPHADPEQLVADAIAALRRQGIRITPTRRLVLDVLAGTSDHLTVEDLHHQVEEREAGIHLATIYRTIEGLGQAGLLDHIHLPHGATTYHLVVDDRGSHCHAMCTQCDQVVDLPPDLLDGVAAGLLAQHGFELNARHVALTGRCAACRDDA